MYVNATRSAAAMDETSTPIDETETELVPIPQNGKNKVQVKNVSNRHEAIIAFLVAEPEMKQSDVARHFKVTPSWLSTLIHSDAFKARLAERQDEFFSAALVPIKDKLETLASTGLDKLQEKLEIETNTGEIREIVKLALDRAGYGLGIPLTPGLAMQQNNFYAVDPDLLTAAKQRILERRNDTSSGSPLTISQTSEV